MNECTRCLFDILKKVHLKLVYLCRMHIVVADKKCYV